VSTATKDEVYQIVSELPRPLTLSLLPPDAELDDAALLESARSALSWTTVADGDGSVRAEPPAMDAAAPPQPPPPLLTSLSSALDDRFKSAMAVGAGGDSAARTRPMGPNYTNTPSSQGPERQGSEIGFQTAVSPNATLNINALRRSRLSSAGNSQSLDGNGNGNGPPVGSSLSVSSPGPRTPNTPTAQDARPIRSLEDVRDVLMPAPAAPTHGDRSPTLFRA